MDTLSADPHQKLPLVSVIIPAYNNGRYLPHALQSVFDQDYPHLEIIVVDDGSTDDTREVLTAFTGRVRVIYQENAGSAVARNTGLRQAHGRYVVLLDADDWLLPGKLHRQVQMLEQRRDLGAVHSGWRIVDGSGQTIHDVEPWHVVPKLDLASWLKWKPVKMGAMLYQRRWLERVGYLDPALRQSQDVDLMLRLALAGCRMTWLREPTLCYRHHGSSTIRSQALQHPHYARRVLDKFYAQPTVPEALRRQETQIRYYQMMWECWHLFRSGFAAESVPYLRQTIAYSPHGVALTVQEWFRNFLKWSVDDGLDPAALKEMWPHFQSAAALEGAAWSRVQTNLEWGLAVWWPYLKGDYGRAGHHLAAYQTCSARELVSLAQFYALYSPRPVSVSLINRFWRAAQQAGLVAPAERWPVISLYMAIGSQALLARDWLTAVRCGVAAMKYSWQPQTWPIWWRYGQAGWLFIRGRERQVAQKLNAG